MEDSFAVITSIKITDFKMEGKWYGYINMASTVGKKNGVPKEKNWTEENISMNLRYDRKIKSLT